MISGGIFGPKLCGKTTLAKELSREYWHVDCRRSFVLDPHLDRWGEQAWVTNNEEKFWAVVWSTKGGLVIVDESAATIRRERSLVPVFTMMRHNRHKLLVIGHGADDLLPPMRRQLDTLYLFRQDEDSVEAWARIFADKQLYDAAALDQYEFLEKHSFRPAIKRRLLLA